VKHTGRESGGELCEIFKFRSCLKSKHVDNVCKLLQLLGSFPDPQASIHLCPWCLDTPVFGRVVSTYMWTPQNLPLLFKMYEIWSVDSQENY